MNKSIIMECKTCKKIRTAITSNSIKTYLNEHPNCINCSIKKTWNKPEIKAKVSGRQSSGWKGDDVKYGGLHDWVRRELGTPGKCEHCGTDDLKAQQIDWANKSGKYKRILTDWIRLCRKCHCSYDWAKKIAQRAGLV